MPYTGSGEVYKGDGREFSAAELYAGARSGRLIVRADENNGLYVTERETGETFHVVPR